MISPQPLSIKEKKSELNILQDGNWKILLGFRQLPLEQVIVPTTSTTQNFTKKIKKKICINVNKNA